MRLQMLAGLTLSLLLTACGAEAPPAAPLAAVDRQSTQVALVERPTLATVPTPADRPTATPAPTLDDLYTLLEVGDDDPRALGQVDAQVVIIEFTDYE
jgi:protein-disulfide isomerase